MTMQKLMVEYEKLKETNNNLISKNEKLVSENESLKVELENKDLQIQNFKNLIFGTKRESTKKVEIFENAEQISFFDDETEQSELKKAAKENIEKITYTRKKKSKKSGIKPDFVSKIPVIIERYEIKKEDLKVDETTELKKIGEEEVSQEIEYIPGKIVIKKVYRSVYKKVKIAANVMANNNVSKTSDALEKIEIIKAEVPTKLLSHTFASPSLVSEIIYEKYNKGVPLYRQEKMWDDRGLVLPRNMMSNWIIKTSEYYLETLYQKMLEVIKDKSKLLHMDETTIQCNKEEDRKASSKSYMWVLSTGVNEEIQGTIFRYSPSRSAKIAEEILSGYKGKLVTDGYGAYDKVDEELDDIGHSICWSHCRRYFFESIPTDKGETSIIETSGKIGVYYCDKLFQIEREIAELSAPQKQKERIKRSKPIVDEFFTWVNLLSQKTILNEKLKKAITYARNQKEKLIKFLEDGEIPLTNNLAERKIRPFAVHRKNWLFADTVAGAKASGVMYSLVESAKQNSLNVWNYINYLLEKLPQYTVEELEENIEKYFPWSKDLPNEVKNIPEETECEPQTIAKESEIPKSK